MTYKWDSPRDWLDSKVKDYIDEGDICEVVFILKCLLNMVDNDLIQDAFQEEMNEDGYFEKESDENDEN